MADAFVLSPEDRDLLTWMLDKARHERDNTQGRPGVRRPDVEAPEHYVAKLVSDLPGLIIEDDIAYPGVIDDAEFYRSQFLPYIYEPSESYETLVKASVTPRKIYNLSGAPVMAGTYIRVMRDKYGKWWVQDSGNPSWKLGNTCSGGPRWIGSVGSNYWEVSRLHLSAPGQYLLTYQIESGIRTNGRLAYNVAAIAVRDGLGGYTIDGGSVRPINSVEAHWGGQSGGIPSTPLADGRTVSSATFLYGYTVIEPVDLALVNYILPEANSDYGPAATGTSPSLMYAIGFLGAIPLSQYQIKFAPCHLDDLGDT